MSEEDDPPPGGGINETVSKVSNIINNINQTATESRQRSFSVSDTSKKEVVIRQEKLKMVLSNLN